MKQEMGDAIRDFALGLFPAGCKFFNEDGSLKMGGELLTAIILDKAAKGERISPCTGCGWFQDCQKEGIGKPKENRLNTDGLEMGSLTEDNMRLLAGVMMSSIDDGADWVFNPDEECDPDHKETRLPWIIRVIRKRIVGERLKIQITKKAYIIIALLVDGNPGKAMFILHKIGNFFEKIKAREWLVTSLVLMRSLFPFGFPTQAAFEKWWDGQKVRGQGWSDNKVDIFPDEWRLHLPEKRK